MINSFTFVVYARVWRDGDIQSIHLIISMQFPFFALVFMPFPTVRFHDVAMRTLMIRAPRDFFAIVRSTITMMTVLGGRRVVLVILRVNGSARTAKRSAIEYTERFYRDRLMMISKQVQQKKNSDRGRDEQKKVNRLCQRLEETIATLHDIE